MSDEMEIKNPRSFMFANNVLYLTRTRNDISLTELLDKADVAYPSFKKYLADDTARGIHLELAYRIAEILGEDINKLTSVNYVMEGAERAAKWANRSADRMREEIGI